MFNNLPIKTRLLTGFMVLIMIFGGLILFGINRMWSLSELTGMMHRHPFAVSNAALRVDANIIKIHRAMKDLVLSLDKEDIRKNTAIISLLETKVYKDFKTITERFLGDKEMYEKPLQDFKNWGVIHDEVLALMYSGKQQEAAAITRGKAALHVAVLEKSMDTLIDFAQNKASEFLENAEETKDNALILMYVLFAAATFSAVIFALMLTRSITIPIETLKNAATAIGEGSLDTKINISARDEIGMLAVEFDEMKGKLKEAYTGLAAKVTEKTKELSDILDQSQEQNIQLRGTRDAMLNLVEDLEDSKEQLEAEQALLQNAKSRLRDINIDLKSTNAELESILFAASHDLRTPLVNIQGFGKELQYSINDLLAEVQKIDIPPEVNKKLSPLVEADIPTALGYIRSGASKMDALLTALLQISRLGRFELDLEKLDMNILISDVIHNLEYKLKESSVRTEVSDLPSCTADGTQLNQVFTNLIENAIKYRDPERDGVIKVSGSKEKDRYIYCVEDNGIGIAPAYQKQIFKLFHRLDPEMSAGEGLGLTIIRKIIDKHHGDIWLESEKGKGSKFFVAIPVKAVTGKQ